MYKMCNVQQIKEAITSKTGGTGDAKQRLESIDTAAALKIQGVKRSFETR